jgi:hypothetical protein
MRTRAPCKPPRFHTPRVSRRRNRRLAGGTRSGTELMWASRSIGAGLGRCFGARPRPHGATSTAYPRRRGDRISRAASARSHRPCLPNDCMSGTGIADGPVRPKLMTQPNPEARAFDIPRGCRKGQKSLSPTQSRSRGIGLRSSRVCGRFTRETPIKTENPAVPVPWGSTDDPLDDKSQPGTSRSVGRTVNSVVRLSSGRVCRMCSQQGPEPKFTLLT